DDLGFAPPQRDHRLDQVLGISIVAGGARRRVLERMNRRDREPPAPEQPTTLQRRLAQALRDHRLVDRGGDLDAERRFTHTATCRECNKNPSPPGRGWPKAG